MQRHKTVDDYIAAHPQWEAELNTLRALVNATKLTETVKWGMPVYTIKNKNVVGIGAFKSHIGLWFYNGALLKDAANKLVNAQEGKTKAMRHWRFSAADEIDAPLVTAYLNEAIANQEAGREMKATKGKPLIIPDELAEALAQSPELSVAFDELTLGKRRDYAEYIAEAKREATKTKRLEKIKPIILAKIGLNDKYL